MPSPCCFCKSLSGILEGAFLIFHSDMDNCLYSRRKPTHVWRVEYRSNTPSHLEIKVQDVLSNLIDNYFEKHLGISREEAIHLH